MINDVVTSTVPNLYPRFEMSIESSPDLPPHRDFVHGEPARDTGHDALGVMISELARTRCSNTKGVCA